ncbi:hypothetical protein HTSR_1860 [Halodesulfurarchaeum formicicum]|uniref:Uncharacterized protein n=1 Tax=Halodesulfurarchaeum formicicum TaxID=1873524 RepID=A0A1D8S6Q1_9EURY|nr:hypothetical protein [Halodesulfurarchaeum formicicum]AOW81025.1 hypothetical protein HTSR_1860 [Halodesulfurarchaeum formicicum]
MPTVHELRNEIRVAVGRHERIESTGFTKEALAAICAAVGAPVDTGRLPPKAEMRNRIANALELEADSFDRSFRKAELEAIASVVRE